MKTINQYITEKLKIRKSSYKYFPETKKELKNLLKQLIEERGNEGNFNDIDTSKITDMSSLFITMDIVNMEEFNGDISGWNVSNVTNMEGMFCGCKSFNQDISNWDVSKVTNMAYMFQDCYKFNQNISEWDVSSVTNMYSMFRDSKSFNQDISNWNVSKAKYKNNMFSNCQIKEKYKPKFS